MSAGRVGSRFENVSDSINRSYRHAVTQPISDRSSYSAVVTRSIFNSVGLQRQFNPTSSESGLN